MFESIFKNPAERMETVVVLSAQRYSIVDEKTGQVIEGVKLSYLTSFEGALRQNFSGVDIMKVNRPIGEFSLYAGEGLLPAVCEFKVRTRSGLKGKAVDDVVAVEYVMPLSDALNA